MYNNNNYIDDINSIPFNEFDIEKFYNSIYVFKIIFQGHNCENVIGYSVVPIGVIGPLTINNITYQIPISTTEGTLVASGNRGAKIVQDSGGIKSIITREGMTRAPVLSCNSLEQLLEVKNYCESDKGFIELQNEFKKSTSHGYLKSIYTVSEDRNIHIRLQCFTGDAMGMNMATKGSKYITDYLVNKFSGLKLISLSGNLYNNIYILVVQIKNHQLQIGYQVEVIVL